MIVLLLIVAAAIGGIATIAGAIAFFAWRARSGRRDAAAAVAAPPAPPPDDGSPASLAARVRDPFLPEADRRGALSRAAGVLDRDDVIALYGVALTSGLAGLRRDGIAGFARLGHRDGIPLLAALIPEADEETLEGLAESLARIGGADSEAPLIALLSVSAPGARLAAARGLGRIGSPDAVPALQALAAESTAPPDVRETASGAIAEIRTRHAAILDDKKERA